VPTHKREEYSFLLFHRYYKIFGFESFRTITSNNIHPVPCHPIILKPVHNLIMEIATPTQYDIVLKRARIIAPEYTVVYE
jgi:hypothetical protein